MSVLTITSNLQLDELMASVPHYLGAHAKDWLNGKVPPAELYIILNLENSNLDGSHWVAICNRPDTPFIEFFDSFGLPCPDTMLNYMSKSGKRIAGTTNEIQNINSQACGYYCVDYLIRRSKGESIYDIIYSYKPNGRLSNDKILLKHLMSDGKNIQMVLLEIFDDQGAPLSMTRLEYGADIIKRILESLPPGSVAATARINGEDMEICFCPDILEEIRVNPDIVGNGFLSGIVNAIKPAAKAVAKAATAAAKVALPVAKTVLAHPLTREIGTAAAKLGIDAILTKSGASDDVKDLTNAIAHESINTLLSQFGGEVTALADPFDGNNYPTTKLPSPPNIQHLQHPI